jgi:hypothetical protein
VTVKLSALIAVPPAVVTVIAPVVAPTGTEVLICPPLSTLKLAVAPLNATALAPAKFVPVITTGVLSDPLMGLKLVILGAGITVRTNPLLCMALTVTSTFPVVAPTGTGTWIEVSPQVVTVAGVPLNITVLPPWVPPKFVPVIVTGAPTVADPGDTLLMLGVGSTVKLNPLLGAPLTVTTTFPVVAPVGTVTEIDVSPQLVTSVAGVPLNVTVLPPWVTPKFVPVIVTGPVTAAALGEMLVMVGDDAATVKFGVPKE